MATTHVFIVDKTTLKYHVEYLFAGTGAKDYKIDFNNQDFTNLHYSKENLLISMIADLERVRENDFVIFYLQQNVREKIYEGKFYGVFQIEEKPFMDNNTSEQFLKEQLGKSLTFRILLKPYKIYSKGVSEWEALDEIKNITSPCQMLWSLIYRKLKGNRGNTMITIYESERLINLIKIKNKQIEIQADNFSFDLEKQKIIKSEQENIYVGRKEKINVLPRLIKKYRERKTFESHLQAYIMQSIGKGENRTLDNLILKESKNIEWIGNEISCGVGMQRIDIGISLEISKQERIFILIELKAVEISVENIKQMKRYIDWLKQYYIPNRISEIKPILICKKQQNKDNDIFKKIISSIKEFNHKMKLNLILIEYEILNTNNLVFSEYNYPIS